MKDVKPKLLPVCECGYIFRDMVIQNDLYNACAISKPSKCPKCKKHITAIVIPDTRLPLIDFSEI